MSSFPFPMIQCEKHPAPTFKSMDENTSILRQLKHENTDVSPAEDIEGNEIQKRQSFRHENDTNKSSPSSHKAVVLESVSEETNSDKLSAEINGEVTEKSVKSCLNAKNYDDFAKDLSEPRPNVAHLDEKCTENKENTNEQPLEGTSLDNDKADEQKLDQRSHDSNLGTNEQQHSTEASDAEIQKRAQEEGLVNVVFLGTVTQEGCCRFVSEILKCVLYQRQQLPMTYDQLVYSQKKQQALMQDKDTVSRRPVQCADMEWRKCQQTLQELEEVLQQLEVLFSLSRVPRVLLLMGGSLVLPKELYEINMEALVMASGDKSLRVSSCLRQLFRSLFVADLLSDTKPVRLMPTTVLVLAHRDCGVGWFRPKLQFKVPTRVKGKVVALSSDLCSCTDLKRDKLDWDDYIWFQAPMTIKGFNNHKA